MQVSRHEIRATAVRKMALLTIGAIAASVALMVVLRHLFGSALDGIVPNLIIAALVPIFVAPLCCWHLISLGERLRIANEHLRTLSETDPLTRTLNRRRFLELFAQHLGLASRHCYPTTLLLIDFDHFKQINDRFGHVVGDRVLAQSSQLMRELCRESDALARFGGEEFVILLPHTARDGGQMVAERIMQRLRELVIHDPVSGLPVGLSVTVSIGGVTSETSDADLDIMMSRADTLLYAAKQSGRDSCLIDVLPRQPGFPLAAVSGL
jgi:diguanylate cyclase (GGDEF)-like protein